MAKKRKPVKPAAHAPASSSSQEKIAISLGDKLKDIGISERTSNQKRATAEQGKSKKPRDQEQPSHKDTPIDGRDDLSRAYFGVTPLKDKGKGRKSDGLPCCCDDSAVGAGSDTVRFNTMIRDGDVVFHGFDINWDRDGDVSAYRRDTDPDVLINLSGKRYHPMATLDLHGMFSNEIELRVSDFVRSQYRLGNRQLLIVHGKGKHSEGGVGVLATYSVKALTQGGAARYVRAFCTADFKHGGSGALAVLLIP
jgi:DNA-nicking Smr family endonuclease